MIARARLLVLLDRAPAALVATLLAASTLAFGGAVWWARPAIAATAMLLVVAGALRATAQRSWGILKSPLILIGGMALLLAIAQLVPLPGSLASRLSPTAHSLYTSGAIPEPAQLDVSESPALERAESRTPATVDRPATLRWLVGAGMCLAVFWAVGLDSDRLDRTLVAWGGVIGSLFLLTAFGLVQLVGGVEDRLYGIYRVGEAPLWTPSLHDLLNVPGEVGLRTIALPTAGSATTIVPRPVVPPAIGGLPGGPGAYLALGSLGLPLALGLAIHCLAPRGSRASLSDRLLRSNRGGLAALLLLLTLLGAGLAGFLAGPVLVIPVLLGLLVAALPGARAAGVGKVAVASTALAVLTLAVGVGVGEGVGRPEGLSPLSSADGWPDVRALWGETAQIAADFPIVGSGLGTFPKVHPYYKGTHLGLTTAWSNLLRFGSEAGVAGMILLALAMAWSLARLPGALRRVGTADRVLAFALVGSLVGFAAFSCVHWTAELPAIGLAASAVAGTFDRWLAGGTDLFVQRG